MSTLFVKSAVQLFDTLHIVELDFYCRWIIPKQTLEIAQSGLF